MKHLTVRNVTQDLEKALRDEQRRRGMSLNATVLDLLKRALGLGPGGEYDNGLASLAGTWTKEELRAFEANTALFEQIDEGLWS